MTSGNKPEFPVTMRYDKNIANLWGQVPIFCATYPLDRKIQKRRQVRKVLNRVATSKLRKRGLAHLWAQAIL